MDYAYIVVAPDGKRLEWHVDDVLAHERADTFNHYARFDGGGYTVERVDRERIVNEYDRLDIPDAMGYLPIALMDDGDTMCEWCVADPFNPVHDARRICYRHDGWGVTAWTYSGECEDLTVCAHCNRILVEGDD